MLNLIGESPLRFVLALVIGVATAWWIWARREGVDAAGNAAPAVPRELSAAPAPPPVPAPAPVSAPEPAAAVPAVALAAMPEGDAAARPNIAAAVGADDDLRKIKGIGPKLDDLCRSLGVRRFDQIAAWGASEIAEVDAHLGNFRGRIERDEWVAQAMLLATGREAEWEAQWGGGTNS